MEKTLGKDFTEGIARKQFLADNCDQPETKSYYKKFSREKLQSLKEELSDCSIEVSDITEEARLSAKMFKEKLKPVSERQAEIIESIKMKAEYVTETVYRFIDHEEGMTGFYNADGELIECRPIKPEERQRNMFAIEDRMKKTGTNQ